MSPLAIAPHSKPARLAIGVTVFDSHDEYVRIRDYHYSPNEFFLNIILNLKKTFVDGGNPRGIYVELVQD